MKKARQINQLRILRIALALLFFVPVTLYLVDFSNKTPPSLRHLVHIQFVPALLSGLLIAWILILAITAVFGRLYCSTLCPAGIMQDIFIRISRLKFWRHDKKNKKSFFQFRKPHNLLRYGLLAATVLFFLSGFSSLVLLFDPYSNYGRVAANLFRPVATFVNNMLAAVAGAGKIEWLVHADIHTVSLAAFMGAIIFFVGVFISSALHGRWFCNTLCPVGSTLSLFSRFSLFQISMDEELCNACGNCTRSCKAECIDYETKKVDSSRCVTCFNCLSHCHRGGLHYRMVNPFSGRNAQPLSETEMNNKKGRRIFFATLTTIAASAGLIPALAQQRKRERRQGEGEHAGDNEKHGRRSGNAKSNEHGAEENRGNEVHSDTAMQKHKPPKAPEGDNGVKHHKQNFPITPPGSGDLEHFLQFCTGCHLCVVKCPDQILRPVGLTYGLSYFLKPEMWYVKNFCNYECTDCSDVCPTDALKKITIDKKQTTQLGKVHFKEDLCVVKTDGTDCGACSEHCPTQAVKMVPYKGALTIPEINNDLCIGCGGCEHICPVRPKRAIFIVANTVHLTVKKPEVKELKAVEVLDFGF